MKKIVNILYTGGWDSTFRLLQLAEYDIQIQPIYFKDSNRKSQTYELKAMSKIFSAVKNSAMFKAEILPLKFFDVEAVLRECANEEISVAFRYLRGKYNIGTQYEWFALLCAKEGLRCESAVVHQYHGKVEEAIEGEGQLVDIEDDFLPNRKKVISKDGNFYASLVFGALILSVLNLTKQDEQRIASEKGWLDIMKLTWFCHSPINGEPCGLCSPCEDAMNTGMEWRMPTKAQWRYTHKNKLWFKLYKKIKLR